ncbi:hypothetical protein [Paenibacillus sp. D2_2]|uniref:hypothetical protein n=1 Tax=Paenibacillus sp. D2_2 TaxID=3073092 RepID=UPI0035C23D0C
MDFETPHSDLFKLIYFKEQANEEDVWNEGIGRLKSCFAAMFGGRYRETLTIYTPSLKCLTGEESPTFVTSPGYRGM